MTGRKRAKSGIVKGVAKTAAAGVRMNRFAINYLFGVGMFLLMAASMMVAAMNFADGDIVLGAALVFLVGMAVDAFITLVMLGGFR